MTFCTYLDIPCSGALGFDVGGNVVLVSGLYSAGVPTPGALNLGIHNISVAKLDATGSKLIYSAAFGGYMIEYPDYTAVDATGNVYITGRTVFLDFLTTEGTIANSSPQTPSGLSGSSPPGGPAASFVAKLSADGTSLAYSTLGSVGEQPAGLAVSSQGEAQLLYVDSINAFGVHRYNNDGSAIAFDTKFNQSHPEIRRK